MPILLLKFVSKSLFCMYSEFLLPSAVLRHVNNAGQAEDFDNQNMFYLLYCTS